VFDVRAGVTIPSPVLEPRKYHDRGQHQTSHDGYQPRNIPPQPRAVETPHDEDDDDHRDGGRGGDDRQRGVTEMGRGERSERNDPYDRRYGQDDELGDCEQPPGGRRLDSRLLDLYRWRASK